MFKIFTEYWFVFIGLFIGILVVVVESTILERRRKRNSSPTEEVMELTSVVLQEKIEKLEIPEGQNPPSQEVKPAGEMIERTAGEVDYVKRDCGSD